MKRIAPSVSSWLLPLAFAAVTSAAGLQWVGISANSEAVRQRASREKLSEFSALLTRLQNAPPADKPAAAEQLAGFADRLSAGARDEQLASASRRIAALTSFEAASADTAIQERLRDEIRSLVSETESLEGQALDRAAQLNLVNQFLMLIAAGMCGTLVVRFRRAAGE